MLKKIMKKKFLISFTAVFILLIIYLVSNEPVQFTQELSYVDNDISVSNIYLMDSYQFISLTTVGVVEDKVEAKAREIIDILIQDGPGENKIPNGFKSIINPDTTLNSLSFENGILKLDFSSNLFDIKEEYEIKVLESLIFSLTSIKDVTGIEIKIDGKLLTELPKSKLKLPKILDKSFGINKDYNVSSLDNVSKVTIYYINKYNDNYYYVPVTKYINNQEEKVNLIIDELRDNNYYLTGLMSFMNVNTSLVDVSIEDNEISLNFDKNLYSDYDTKEVLKEVISSINLSIEATYGIKSVSYTVENEPLIFN